MDFERSRKYDMKWIIENQMGLNPLLLTEWAVHGINISNSSIVLDLASGKAISSIFLAKEFGCKVISADLWIDPTDNQKRIVEQGLESLIIPLKANARELPFPKDYFDLIVCSDSFIYFGTDDLFIPYIREYVKIGGFLSFTVPGFPNEEPKELPEHLLPFWADECWTWHNIEWWKHHIDKFGYFTVLEPEVLPDGINRWIEWKQLRKQYGDNSPSIETDIEVMKKDNGRYMNFIKIVAQREH